MKLKERNGYVVATEGIEGRIALVHSHRALDFLECFANMALFMQYRLRTEGVLPKSSEDIPNYFGFSATSERNWQWLYDQQKGNLFLLNYFVVSRKMRPTKDKPIIRGKKPPTELQLWTTQIQRTLLDCVCGCYADCMIQRADFAGYVGWFNTIRDVASRYAYEFDQYRYLLCMKPNPHRKKFLEETYNLRIYKEFDRSFLEGKKE